MAQDIKKIIAQEYIKCAKDPAYFMRKYCYIQHPTRGRILFNLYPFQDKVLHLFRDHQYLITLKSKLDKIIIEIEKNTNVSSENFC